MRLTYVLCISNARLTPVPFMSFCTQTIRRDTYRAYLAHVVRTYLVCVEVITPYASDPAYEWVALLGAGHFAAQVGIRVPLARLKRSILKKFVV